MKKRPRNPFHRPAQGNRPAFAHVRPQSGPPPGLFYDPRYLTFAARTEILKWLETLHPLWENRYSEHNPPPLGGTQRQLLRPVYWLGNWQFACLNYYHPPKGIQNRCVQAEPYPPALASIVQDIERKTRKMFPPKDIPKGWQLNTCLVNFYGTKQVGDKNIDGARVGEHKDFEPGPVASLSLGERAMFQFVESRGKHAPARVVFQQWLEDRSLQIFGTPRWKEKYFHRVQRVEKKLKQNIGPNIPHFSTRRINFTFRFVPPEHILPYRALPAAQKDDTRGYMEELANHSSFFKREMEGS